MAKKNYDFVVIGNSLTSALLATEIAELNSSVLWVETRRSLGEGGHQPRHRSLEYVPARRAESLTWLNNEFLLGLDAHEEELTPRTFEEGEFKSFLGFGERTVNADEVLRFFMDEKQIRTQLKPEEIIGIFKEKFKGEVLANCEVTEIQIEDQRVQEVVVNGSQKISGNEIIFADSLKKLLELLPDLNPQWRTKISKAPVFHRVSLHFEHSEVVTDELSMNFLMSNSNTAKTKKKTPDPEVCIGRFFNNEEGTQSSTWVSYISEEEAEEAEAIGALIRFMKRQIKRAYPEALETTTKENILVTHEAEGFVDLKLAEDARFPDAKNMLVASARSTESHDWIAEVDAAAQVRDQLARL